MSEVLVVKLGGTTAAGQRQILDEVVRLARRRPVVVVHGGGVRVTEWLTRLGVPTRFEDGLRVTDEPALEVAAAVLAGAVNTELVAELRRRGADAVGLSGVDGGLFVAERVPGKGLVASVVDVRRDLLDALLVSGRVVVVAPLALDETGEVCNVNADDAAAGLARSVGSRQLVLLTDVDGIRGTDGTRLSSLSEAEAEGLIAGGVVAGGMVPKVRSALRAVAGRPGAEAIVADGADPRALARALAEPGYGTHLHGPTETATPGPARRPAGGRRSAARPERAEAR